MQFVMALLGTTCVQKGVLWWAAHHRTHHKYSDEPEDLHSVRQRGFWWSHVGWIHVSGPRRTDWKRIPDFAKYPELVWLNTYPTWSSRSASRRCSSPSAARSRWCGGFFVSTTLLWHGTFTINSLSHVFASAATPPPTTARTTGCSRSSRWARAGTNNHHHYQRSTSQGFFWWEIDLTMYVLRALSWMRAVSDLSEPPERVPAGGVCSSSAVIDTRSSSVL